MGAINTKYSVGDKVYLVDSRGISNEYIRVILEEVKGIKISEHGGVTYEFRVLSRSERDIYTSLDDAKKAASQQAKSRYKKNLEIIADERLADAYLQEAE